MARDGFGEAMRLTLGDDDVGMMEEPVHRRGGESSRPCVLTAQRRNPSSFRFRHRGPRSSEPVNEPVNEMAVPH